MASSQSPDDPLNTSCCLLPPSYFDVSEPEQEEQHQARLRRNEATSPIITEAINAAIGQQFERMAHLTNQLQRAQDQLSDRKAEVQSLQQKVADTEAAAAKRLAAVCAEYERKLNANETLARDALRRIEEERQGLVRRANEEEAALLLELQQARASLESAQEVNAELRLKLNDSSAALEASRKEVEQLGTFQRWEKDRWQVLDRCEQLEEGVKEATAASDLKQQRLDALQSILALQEEELARHGSGEELEALQGLVGRWRQKVFALLVQAESSRQAAASETRKGAVARAEVGRELERSRGLVAQLDLKLSAARAELIEEQGRVQQLTSKLREAEEAAKAAVKDRDAWCNAVTGLRGSVEAAMAAVVSQERQFAVRALGPLAASERRLQSLAERLPVLKAHLKRLRAREALEQLRAEFESRESDLRRELAIVREDRDRLAGLMERDAEARENGENDLRRQYEAQIVSLERNLETLRLEVAVKSDSLEQAQDERCALAVSCDSLREERERLAEQVAELEAQRDSAVSAATTDLFAEHEQQMSELRAALEDARREHAKAVLSMRQTERDLDRCRVERASEVAALEEAARRREAALEAELSRTAAEANVLRATVRQEGLLRSRGSVRPGPRLAEFAEEPERQPEPESGKASGSPHKAPEEFQPHLVNLIEEVRSLVRSVETSALYGTDEEEDED